MIQQFYCVSYWVVHLFFKLFSRIAQSNWTCIPFVPRRLKLKTNILLITILCTSANISSGKIKPVYKIRQNAFLCPHMNNGEPIQLSFSVSCWCDEYLVACFPDRRLSDVLNKTKRNSLTCLEVGQKFSVSVFDEIYLTFSNFIKLQVAGM